MSEYTQKYAFVTGSSRGIGRAIALRLAAEGYHIFLNCSRSFDSLEETRQEIEKIGTCTLVPGDIGNPDTVRKIFHTIAETCDHLDVLVNNAGISHIGLLMDMTDEDWDKVLSSNLSSVFYCCRAAIPPMLSHGSGRIINISSMWGVNGASCEAAYSASKAGVGGLTLNKVAERLEALAQRRQMLLITHWPQLASRAFRHFRVTKQVKDGKTFTQCIRLDERERKTELARMAGIES